VVTNLDPLAYGVDALRTTLIGRTYFGTTLDVIVLVAVSGVLLAVGRHLFSRIQI
jgi:ABC-type polysaccharide/polyol phosphate export permease